MSKTLLVDGDVLAFRHAASGQEEFDWGDGVWSYAFDLDAAVVKALNQVGTLCGIAGADTAVLCFSDSANFRKEVLPSYKANRTGRKPMGYAALVQALCREFINVTWPNLEADDVLGIMQTERDNTVIATIDKDLRTIPGAHLDMKNPVRVEHITELDANRAWMRQVLVGDAVDGYRGCPGIGKKRAELIIHRQRTIPAMWDAVCKAFDAAGFSEEEALTQARVARILRDGEYCVRTGAVTLWSPN